eukprot:TRINITY_DN27240_c0_g1_i1.p1 TRINITY_DN27240_c0_g1~~TRINITY_DN27240_c0_g1_i1.p1  ORF type:complete len:1500 (+),score=406.92 TRINITY_DN27240_c0_g1_i1:184-4683(+)
MHALATPLGETLQLAVGHLPTERTIDAAAHRVARTSKGQKAIDDLQRRRSLKSSADAAKKHDAIDDLAMAVTASPSPVMSVTVTTPGGISTECIQRISPLHIFLPGSAGADEEGSSRDRSPSPAASARLQVKSGSRRAGSKLGPVALAIGGRRSASTPGVSNSDEAQEDRGRASSGVMLVGVRPGVKRVVRQVSEPDAGGVALLVSSRQCLHDPSARDGNKVGMTPQISAPEGAGQATLAVTTAMPSRSAAVRKSVGGAEMAQAIARANAKEEKDTMLLTLPPDVDVDDEEDTLERKAHSARRRTLAIKQGAKPGGQQAGGDKVESVGRHRKARGAVSRGVSFSAEMEQLAEASPRSLIAVDNDELEEKRRRALQGVNAVVAMQRVAAGCGPKRNAEGKVKNVKAGVDCMLAAAGGTQLEATNLGSVVEVREKKAREAERLARGALLEAFSLTRRLEMASLRLQEAEARLKKAAVPDEDGIGLGMDVVKRESERAKGNLDAFRQLVAEAKAAKENAWAIAAHLAEQSGQAQVEMRHAQSRLAEMTEVHDAKMRQDEDREKLSEEDRQTMMKKFEKVMEEKRSKEKVGLLDSLRQEAVTTLQRVEARADNLGKLTAQYGEKASKAQMCEIEAEICQEMAVECLRHCTRAVKDISDPELSLCVLDVKDAVVGVATKAALDVEMVQRLGFVCDAAVQLQTELRTLRYHIMDSWGSVSEAAGALHGRDGHEGSDGICLSEFLESLKSRLWVHGETMAMSITELRIILAALGVLCAKDTAITNISVEEFARLDQQEGLRASNDDILKCSVLLEAARQREVWLPRFTGADRCLVRIYTCLLEEGGVGDGLFEAVQACVDGQDGECASVFASAVLSANGRAVLLEVLGSAEHPESARIAALAALSRAAGQSSVGLAPSDDFKEISLAAHEDTLQFFELRTERKRRLHGRAGRALGRKPVTSVKSVKSTKSTKTQAKSQQAEGDAVSRRMSGDSGKAELRATFLSDGGDSDGISSDEGDVGAEAQLELLLREVWRPLLTEVFDTGWIEDDAGDFDGPNLLSPLASLLERPKRIGYSEALLRDFHEFIKTTGLLEALAGPGALPFFSQAAGMLQWMHRLSAERYVYQRKRAGEKKILNAFMALDECVQSHEDAGGLQAVAADTFALLGGCSILRSAIARCLELKRRAEDVQTEVSRLERIAMGIRDSFLRPWEAARKKLLTRWPEVQPVRRNEIRRSMRSLVLLSKAVEVLRVHGFETEWGSEVLGEGLRKASTTFVPKIGALPSSYPDADPEEIEGLVLQRLMMRDEKNVAQRKKHPGSQQGTTDRQSSAHGARRSQRKEVTQLPYVVDARGPLSARQASSSRSSRQEEDWRRTAAAAGGGSQSARTMSSAAGSARSGRGSRAPSGLSLDLSSCDEGSEGDVEMRGCRRSKLRAFDRLHELGRRIQEREGHNWHVWRQEDPTGKAGYTQPLPDVRFGPRRYTEDPPVAPTKPAIGRLAKLLDSSRLL